MDVRMPKPIKRQNSKFYWLRKRVPDRYRALVGRKEVWQSLGTADHRQARVRCVVLGDELERTWAGRLQAREAGLPDPVTHELSVTTLSDREAAALAGAAYREFVERHADNPASHDWKGALETHAALGARRLPMRRAEQKLYIYWKPISEFLSRENLRLDTASLHKFAAAFYDARGYAQAELLEKANGNWAPSSFAQRFPELHKKVDAAAAFEVYAKEAGLAASTRKRWRPVMGALTSFLKHSDLARVSREQAVAWKDFLLTSHSNKTVRDVYLAAAKAVCQFLVDNSKLPTNVFAGIKVRGVKESKHDDEKGFSDADALTILTATLDTPSNLISAETAAARRWIPWICAYTGARVNEITSLLPSDFRREQDVECIVLRAEITKGREPRTIPLHEHLLEQGLLAYAAERRKAGKPLFYDPARSRGGADADPHFKKVGQRLAEWVKGLGVDPAIAPNHGWRHRWRSISRDVGMHPEVADFIFGHGSGSISARYGKKLVSTASRAIALIPPYEVPALDQPSKPHRRRHRSKPRSPIPGSAPARIAVHS